MHFLSFFGGKYGHGQTLKGQNKKMTYSIAVSQFLGMFLSKKFGPSTCQFCGYKGQRLFSFSILTHFFKFGCIFGYHVHIFDKTKFNTPTQNLILSRLVPISNLTNDKQKSSCAIFFLLRFVFFQF